jgi:TolB-like protein
LRFLFGDYVLDTARRELSRGGQQVALEPQVFDLLVYLLKSRERVVSKDDLLASVWGGRIVSDATLDSRITAARRVVGDSGAAQTLIRTFPRRGVRFVGEVREEAKSAALAPEMVAEQGRPVTWCAASPRPRLSIVVLPFSNFSADRDQDYFADGITDDLTTDLSRIADSFVIARRTAFTYKGKAVDVRQIGRELGVRYALEGSIRRSGRHVRANTQLIDTDTGAHLWAERFDHDACDLLALQDEITSRIAFALNLELVAAEVTRPTDYPDALDCILRGRAALSKPLSRDTTPRQSASLSTRWRSIRKPSTHRAGWRTASPAASIFR